MDNPNSLTGKYLKGELKIEVPKTKDAIYAQLYTKKRKNGYFEVSLAVGAPLDSPFYF